MNLQQFRQVLIQFPDRKRDAQHLQAIFWSIPLPFGKSSRRLTSRIRNILGCFVRDYKARVEDISLSEMTFPVLDHEDLIHSLPSFINRLRHLSVVY
jgi:hypothetical protein